MNGDVHPLPVESTLKRVMSVYGLGTRAFESSDAAAEAGSRSRMAGCVHDGTDGGGSRDELKRDETGEVPRDEPERGEAGGEETVTERDRCR